VTAVSQERPQPHTPHRFHRLRTSENALPDTTHRRRSRCARRFRQAQVNWQGSRRSSGRPVDPTANNAVRRRILLRAWLSLARANAVVVSQGRPALARDDTRASGPAPAGRLLAMTSRRVSRAFSSSTACGRRACRASCGPCGDAGNNPCRRQAVQLPQPARRGAGRRRARVCSRTDRWLTHDADLPVIASALR
jgi:hypothetical protein